MLINKIYDVSPVSVRTIFFNIYAFFNDYRRYGRTYRRIEQECFDRLFMDEESLRNYQRLKLKKHMEIAQTSIFWSKKFKEFGVNTVGDPFIEIAKLPVLEKDEVKANLDDLKPSCYKRKTTIAHTSGTTGAGMIFPVSVEAEQEQWAVWWRYRKSLGINRNDWCGLFGGRSIKPVGEISGPYHINNFVSKQISFSQYHLSIDTIDAYLDVLNKKRLKWLHGYPSFIASISELALSKGLKLNYTPDVITLGAENLLEHQRISIQSFFGVTPFQHYGLAEGTANFSQDPGEDKLIVDEDFSFVEFIESPAGIKIVGTNFLNSAFPLFRYNCADIAHSVNSSEFPRTLKGVDGRLEDSIFLPDGRQIGRLDHIFKDAIYVREAQIHQVSVDHLIVRVVPQHSWESSFESSLRQSFCERLGDELKIEILLVDQIARTKSGKLRFVTSELN